MDDEDVGEPLRAHRLHGRGVGRHRDPRGHGRHGPQQALHVHPGAQDEVLQDGPASHARAAAAAARLAQGDPGPDHGEARHETETQGGPGGVGARKAPRI